MSDESPTPESADTPNFTMEDARKIALAWEKLRLFYNAILVGMVILGVLWFWYSYWPEKSPVTIPSIFISCVVGAVGANICFTAGPVVEIYFHWLGVRHRAIRSMLFVVGVLISMPLVLITMGWFTIP